MRKDKIYSNEKFTKRAIDFKRECPFFFGKRNISVYWPNAYKS
jgi:hypothetical protein